MAEKIVPGIIKRILRKVDFQGKLLIQDGLPVIKGNGELYLTYEEPVVADLEEANIITSSIDKGNNEDHSGYSTFHAPVLDFDFECTLLESSTPGKHHLLIDRTMHWNDYQKLLIVLGEVGLLEPGYVKASLERGYSAIRLPWIKKEKNDRMG